MTEDSSLALVMSRLHGGDQAAAQEIFHRFVHRLVALASQQFDARLRTKTDPEDVVQSVYRSFFMRHKRSPYQFADWDSLWALLATITVRKCLDKRTYWHAARRHLSRELVPSVDEANESYRQALDRGPTPLQAVVLAELIEVILAGLPAKHRIIGELILQGYLISEIAETCGCSERTVARVIARMKGQLSSMNDDPAPG